MDVLERISELFSLHGGRTHAGDARYPVTALAHALQCAQQAEWAHAGPDLVCAALLHDIGHFVAPEMKAAPFDDLHELRSIRLLDGAFGATVIEPIRLHVHAKRYLVAVERGYEERLSPGSMRSLLQQGGPMSRDEAYRLAAQAHAQMTAAAFIRPDGSTYHAVEYDTDSGERRRGYTFQGAADESFWSRGQGWAIYGYVNSARETGKLAYLQLAERLAQAYIQRLDGRQVPPWDFDATGDDARIKDTAAAAVVASALIEMGRIHPDQATGAGWGHRGCAMLEALCRDEFASEAGHRGLLKHSCYSKPHNEGVDSATMFGDFFFAEALCRVALPGGLRPELDVELR